VQSRAEVDSKRPRIARLRLSIARFNRLKQQESATPVNRQPSSVDSPTSFVKAFAGVFGRLDPARLPATPSRIDFHPVRVRETSNNRLYLIGTSVPAVPLVLPLATDAVAVKGRPFWLSKPETQERPNADSFDRILPSLDGKFSLCAASAAGLYLATDLIGAGPVYYSVGAQCIFYATHPGLVLWLLGETPAFNRLGVVSTLISRAQVERETLFSNVFRLGAGERVAASWNGGDLVVNLTRYAALADVLSRDVQGLPAGPDALGELLGASLARENYPPGVALMLSGGRDSRAIALAQPRRDYVAVSFGTADSTDLRHAKLLAKGLAIEHRAVPDDWTYATYAKQIVGLHAGATGLQSTRNILGSAWARQFFSLNILGYLGDALTGAHLGVDEDAILRRRRTLLFPQLSAPDVPFREIFPDEVNHLVETVNQQIAALSGLTAAQALMVQDWTIRQASWISLTFDMTEWYCDVSYPFYYRPLLQHMFHRPLSDLRNQSLYDAWLGSAAARKGLQRLPLRQKTDDILTFIGSLLRTGHRPNSTVAWPAMTDRSREWLETNLLNLPGPFQELSKRSYDYFLRTRRNRIPTFLLSLPITLASQTAWQSTALMAP
jgi:hypothetical protein